MIEFYLLDTEERKECQDYQEDKDQDDLEPSRVFD